MPATPQRRAFDGDGITLKGVEYTREDSPNVVYFLHGLSGKLIDYM